MKRTVAKRPQIVTEPQLWFLHHLRRWFGIEDGRDAWVLLALRLAEGYARVPLRPRQRAGRPAVWSDFECIALAGDMCRELENGSQNPTAAARTLAAREPWASFCRQRRRKKGGGSPPSDPGEALLTQYRKIKASVRKRGEDAFHDHVRPGDGDIEGWDAYVRYMLFPQAAWALDPEDELHYKARGIVYDYLKPKLMRHIGGP